MRVTHQKCDHHPRRKAAARCPACEGFFCKECITEHEGKVICASCLDAKIGDRQEEEQALTGIRHVLQVVVGIFMSWIFFYGIARLLLELSEPLKEELPL